MKTPVKTARTRARFDPAMAEVEALESARANLSHAEAIRRSVFISRQCARMGQGELMAMPVDFYEVVRALNAKKVPYVITGAHAIHGYTGRPRATRDVDVLAKAGRNHLRAVNALKARFPELEVRQLRQLTAFFPPGEKTSVIDVSLPFRKDNAEALVDTVLIDDKENGVRYRIPSLECALANKYGAMVVVTRAAEKRLMDVADFTLMVKHSDDQEQKPIDLVRLEALGELVWAGGGGEEILRLVDRVREGKVIDLNALAQES
jgi:hypothetical protein